MLLKVAALAATVLVLATVLGQRGLPSRLDLAAEAAGAIAVLDRDGQLLHADHDGGWNLHERVDLQAIPLLLREAVVAAEDRRYWQHSGVDWQARLAAAWQNLRAGYAQRGASTISEQVVRLLNPRPRTLWARWVEGWEAMRLEARFSKAEILEFYLNQVPYASNRRGVLAAARHHFGRHLDTLSETEMLALAVLVRAPSRLAREPAALRAGIQRLLPALRQTGALGEADQRRLQGQTLMLSRRAEGALAAHFQREVGRRAQMLAAAPHGRVRSSLDAPLQQLAESYLDERLKDLSREGARQGAVLIVEVPGNRVRAWAVNDQAHPHVVGVDSVLSPRQPGSTLKPLLYALAMEHGWDADTLIDDSPLAERVNRGLHQYRNYSRTHYGAVTLREALGNSLNIPAVKALQFVGGAAFLERLHHLGMHSLSEHPNVYGDGLALGNGEVSLYELVQAYTALAAEGRWQPLTVFAEDLEPRMLQRAYSPQVARAVNAILADPAARQLEFGEGGVLRFPAATAVKTGTSSDYRDAWTVAYDGRYVVGVWVGNLSGRETEGVTGARGPALLTRSLLAALAPYGRELPRAELNPDSSERQLPGPERAHDAPQILQPFDGLQLAMDPRIPDALEAFEFQLAWNQVPRVVHWQLDGHRVASGVGPTWAWPLQPGRHRLRAEVVAGDGRLLLTPEVSFQVR